MENKDEIIVYQPQSTLRLEVRIQDETVWLTQAQIAELFGTRRQAITKHLQNIFKSGELNESLVSSILELTASDGKNYVTKIYNLDAIISVGYRVNSRNATLFRQWATQVLRNYLLKGYSINQRMDRMEHTLIEQGQMLAEHDKKIDFFIKTSLPPVEGVFYDGQLFDAYKFVADLIRTATTSLILIDNYIDDTVLTLFTKRIPGIKVTIYTAQISKQLSLDLQRHNSQYEPIDIRQFNQSHDRFLIIDEKELYHIGASLKDLGKKWFAFSKIQLDIRELLSHL
ncbi:virulence RhuM family protein [Parabacteroides sp. BX2]|uniref:Virulence RhuM family protein n=1 Tax=Parabacteroides segnis TaxID=2763058 RepID=A0ABR7EBU4_9BACT|nr:MULTISPECIES: RhuM family protein [Parabacteroides]MBC5646594.1 virulence RhuM family protein [Parabacteroides segnis]MCM0716515.1 virulence RhuM family protein [Parabacteroides sp. TA-V-105]